MTFIDIFAGTGGFRRGMELAGHKCVGFCEFDKYAVRSYIAMHLLTDGELLYLSKRRRKQAQKYIDNYILPRIQEREWYANDVRAINVGTMPRADCWCFGFPCQDISVAGKQSGLNGERSGLFYAVTDLLRKQKEENRPEWLFIENVKNLLSINGGWDFAAVLIELEQVGYDCSWQVLNSKDYGVPQNREMVFIIGHLGIRGRREIFPISGTASENRINQIGRDNVSKRKNPTQYRVYDCDGLAPCLSSMQGGNVHPHIKLPQFCDLNYGAGLIVTENARCLQARYNKGITNRKGESSGVAVPVLTPDRISVRQNGRRFKEDGEPMFTLTGQDRHSVMIKEATKQGYKIAKSGDSINLSVPGSKTRRGRVGEKIANTLDTGCNQGVLSNHRIRKLTPKECFRLQGWEDIYFDRAALVNSDSQLYKQAGNGVTVTVIQAIGERLLM